MKVTLIGVAGAGQMGSKIAQVALLSGYAVLLYDVDPEAVKRTFTKMRRTFEKMCEQGKLTDEKIESLMQSIVSVKLEGNPDNKTRGLGAADFVIEAIVEDSQAKKNLYRVLERDCYEHTIIVSNTSTILIDELAEGIERKDKFMGMHFMNPPDVLTLLEVIRGPETSDETFETVMEVAQQLGRTPVLESPDIAGFTVNGIVLPLINEAARLVGRGADPETVDRVFEGQVTTGTKPMGVLKLADLIGLDTCVAGLAAMAQEDPHYEPHPVLTQMVREGRLGRKVGRGFFTYEKK